MKQTAGIVIERNMQDMPGFARVDFNKREEKEKKIAIDDLKCQEKDAFIHTAKINASKIFSKYL
jgi:hypothetical protein